MSKAQFPGRIVVESTIRKAAAFVADLVRTIICQAVGDSGSCSVALVGGTTPHALYQLLARSAVTDAVPWQDADIYFGDERDVPHDHVDSNFHMAQRTLLDHVPVDPARVHPMPADCGDLERAAARYEQLVRKNIPAGGGDIPRFDLILLGMGGEGHTASLFPFTDVLDETERLVVSHFIPVLGRERMTFTFPLINAARNILVLVTGEDKAEAIAALVGDDEKARRKLPVSRVRPADGRLVMALDAAAARLTNLRA